MILYTEFAIFRSISSLLSEKNCKSQCVCMDLLYTALVCMLNVKKAKYKIQCSLMFMVVYSHEVAALPNDVKLNGTNFKWIKCYTWAV